MQSFALKLGGNPQRHSKARHQSVKHHFQGFRVEARHIVETAQYTLCFLHLSHLGSFHLDFAHHQTVLFHFVASHRGA
jgi:hypothetical protein